MAIDTFVVRRPSLIDTKIRGRDEPAPEAHLWRLTEGMVRSGRLRPVQMTEVEFAAAVHKYCPDLEVAIYTKLGLKPVVSPGEVRRGRPRGTRTVLTTAPTPLFPTQLDAKSV